MTLGGNICRRCRWLRVWSGRTATTDAERASIRDRNAVDMTKLNILKATTPDVRSPPAEQGTATVCLESENVGDAFTLALREHKFFEDEEGDYGDNRLSRHLVGKLGEFAAWEWFRQAEHTVRPWFVYKSRRYDCDLEAERPDGPDLRVEVKACQNKFVEEFAGGVTRRKLRGLFRNSNVVVWVQVPDIPLEVDLGDQFNPASLGDMLITLDGWNHVDDVMIQGRPIWVRDRPNLRLSSESWQAMTELAELNLLKPISRQPEEELACGHEPSPWSFGHC